MRRLQTPEKVFHRDLAGRDEMIRDSWTKKENNSIKDSTITGKNLVSYTEVSKLLCKLSNDHWNS